MATKEEIEAAVRAARGESNGPGGFGLLKDAANLVYDSVPEVIPMSSAGGIRLKGGDPGSDAVSLPLSPTGGIGIVPSSNSVSSMKNRVASNVGADLHMKDPEPDAGTPGNLTGTDEALRGIMGGTAMEAYLRNHTTGPRQGDGKVVMPEGHDYLSIGENGKDSFQRAYTDQPNAMVNAVDESEKAQEAKNEALGQHYNQELQRSQSSMAAMQAKRQENDLAIQNKLKNLDQATTYYSNDLADRGKFWHSPGNIVSAIAFSLMPIFSNDPAIGIKLINQAIDKDMADRKDLASMHLGELRSNLGNFRKLADDQVAGDMLAESEARRIAAMQVEKIANNFESPISKAKAEAIKADLLMKAEIQKQQAFNHYIYNMPKLVDKRIAGGYAKQGESAMSPFDELAQRRQAEQAPMKPGMAGFGARGTIAGTASTASADGKTVPLTPQQQAVMADPNAGVKAIIEGRIPGGMPAAMFAQQMIAVQAAASSPNGMMPGDPHFEKAKDVIVDRGLEKLGSVQVPLGAIAQETNGVKRLQEDMQVIERSVKDPNAFIGSMRNIAPDGFNSWWSNVSQKMGSEPGTPAAERANRLRDAAARFHQLAMGNIVEYYHSKAGANQSPGEEGRLGQIVRSDYSWQQLHGFVDQRSTALANQERTIIAGLPVEAQLVWYAKMGVSGQKSGLATAPHAAPNPKMGPPLAPGAPLGPGQFGPPSQ